MTHAEQDHAIAELARAFFIGKPGSRVTFTPHDPTHRTTTGIVQEEIQNQRGSPGLHIMPDPPDPRDPTNVVRVWLDEGDLTRAE